MDDMRTKPCGLIIKLGKDTLGGRHGDNNYVLGYFDRLEFQAVNRWLDFSPNKTALGTCTASGQVGSQPVSSYPIKLLFPTMETIAELEKEGLDYECWMKVGRMEQECLASEDPSLFEQYPCITVVLVNLTDGFKADYPRDICGDLLKRFVKVVGSFEDPNFKDAHCCVFPTLGYSDYCILFAEKSWNIAPALLEYLHGCYASVGEGKRRVPVLSTDYMMPVYHIAENGRKIEVNSHTHGIQLAVRVYLRPGVSMDHLKHDIQEVAVLQQTTGSADCLIISHEDKDFSKLLRMLMPKHPFGDDSLKCLVIDTEATLLRTIKNTDYSGRGTNQDKEAGETNVSLHAFQQLREVLEDYQKLIYGERRHTRQLRALYERVAAIENICGENHNDSLRLIMSEWITAFSHCLKMCVDGFNNRDEGENGEEEWDEGSREEIWMHLEEALERFNGQVGSFLADISRSDSFFMETERYNHPSVSSATALLLAYNRWQNGFAKAVMSEEGDANSTYSFLVRSGGCDNTNTTNLFWFLSPDIKEDASSKWKSVREKLPLIIQMSEMSLYDCGGAIFRMTHECMHYCGDRKREDRAKHVLCFTSRYYGWRIGNALFNESLFLEPMEDRINSSSLINANDKKDLIEKITILWKSYVTKICESISKWMEDKLLEELNKDSLGWKETDYMISAFSIWLQEKLSIMFSSMRFDLEYDDVDSSTIDQLPGFLYYSQIHTVESFYHDGNKIITECDDSLSVFELASRLMREYLKKDSTDEKLKNKISRVLNRLLVDWRHKIEIESLDKMCYFSVEEVLVDVIFDCFSESFADLEACIRLNASLSDYLLGFVYENWNLKTALPIRANYIYRIPAVLRACFSNSLSDDLCSLNEMARMEIKEAIDKLNAHGLPTDRLSLENLVTVIDQMLMIYNKCQFEADALEDYLVLCKNSYKDSGTMNGYSKIFKSIRLLSSNTDSDSIAQIFSSLTMIKG